MTTSFQILQTFLPEKKKKKKNLEAWGKSDYINHIKFLDWIVFFLSFSVSHSFFTFDCSFSWNILRKQKTEIADLLINCTQNTLCMTYLEWEWNMKLEIKFMLAKSEGREEEKKPHTQKENK